MSTTHCEVGNKQRLPKGNRGLNLLFNGGSKNRCTNLGNDSFITSWTFDTPAPRDQDKDMAGMTFCVKPLLATLDTVNTK